MSQDSTCPICYEAMDFVSYTNIISTECGHKFHCACLLKHTSINGYGCPCCRTQMVETDHPNRSIPDLTLSSDQDTIPDTDQIDDYFNPGPLEDESYILDGVRWMFQQAYGLPIDNITPHTDDFEYWIQQYRHNEQIQEERLKHRMNQYMETLEQIKALQIKDFVWAFVHQMDNRFAGSSLAHEYNQKVLSTMISIRERLPYTQNTV